MYSRKSVLAASSNTPITTTNLSIRVPQNNLKTKNRDHRRKRMKNGKDQPIVIESPNSDLEVGESQFDFTIETREYLWRTYYDEIMIVIFCLILCFIC